MLQNKFFIGQTVVVMQGKKLVEMQVDSIDTEGKKLVYELKLTTKVKEDKTKGNAIVGSTYAELVEKAFKSTVINVASPKTWGREYFATPYPQPLRRRRSNAIVLDDLDNEAGVIESYHTYKENQIWADRADFVANVQVVSLPQPKAKKVKKAA